MTEQKPIVWVYESTGTSEDWRWYASSHRPADRPYRRNIQPVFAQPATDPAVEAARRKALRAVFRALDATEGYSDLYSVRLAAGVLRDLVGQRPDDTRVSICGYDEEPKEAAAPAMPSWAFRSVDEVAECLAAGHCGPEYPGWRLLLEHEREPWREKARRLIERARQAV